MVMIRSERRDERAARWARTGMTWAFGPALLLLAALAVILLRSEGSSVKVLVAVWLWMLPVLGIFAAIGWLAGRLAASFAGGRPAPVMAPLPPDQAEE